MIIVQNQKSNCKNMICESTMPNTICSSSFTFDFTLFSQLFEKLIKGFSSSAQDEQHISLLIYFHCWNEEIKPDIFRGSKNLFQLFPDEKDEFHLFTHRPNAWAYVRPYSRAIFCSIWLQILFVKLFKTIGDFIWNFLAINFFYLINLRLSLGF